MQAARTLKADPSRSTLSESTNKGGDSNQSAADLTAKLSKLKALSEADKQQIATLQAKLQAE